jgi:hypothetical protein
VVKKETIMIYTLLVDRLEKAEERIKQLEKQVEVLLYTNPKANKLYEDLDGESPNQKVISEKVRKRLTNYLNYGK